MRNSNYQNIEYLETRSVVRVQSQCLHASGNSNMRLWRIKFWYTYCDIKFELCFSAMELSENMILMSWSPNVCWNPVLASVLYGGNTTERLFSDGRFKSPYMPKSTQIFRSHRNFSWGQWNHIQFVWYIPELNLKDSLIFIFSKTIIQYDLYHNLYFIEMCFKYVTSCYSMQRRQDCYDLNTIPLKLLQIWLWNVFICYCI